jgi:hypothetical protein
MDDDTAKRLRTIPTYHVVAQRGQKIAVTIEDRSGFPVVATRLWRVCTTAATVWRLQTTAHRAVATSASVVAASLCRGVLCAWHPESRRHSAAATAAIGLALFLIGTQLGVQAQTAQADRAQLTQSQIQTPLVPSISPQGTTEEHAVPGPNDADLGEQEVLKRVERYEPWTVSIASPVFYTTNVALTDHGEKHDIISAPVAAVYYQPHIVNTLYGFADVRQQFFYYNHYNDFDFGSLDIEAGLIYYLPQFHNLVLRGEYDFNRLTFSDRVLDEFFTNHALIFNAEIPFRFGRAQQLSLGADANISVAADDQGARRNDYEAYAG